MINESIVDRANTLWHPKLNSLQMKSIFIFLYNQAAEMNKTYLWLLWRGQYMFKKCVALKSQTQTGWLFSMHHTYICITMLQYPDFETKLEINNAILQCGRHKVAARRTQVGSIWMNVFPTSFPITLFGKRRKLLVSVTQHSFVHRILAAISSTSVTTLASAVLEPCFQLWYM